MTGYSSTPLVKKLGFKRGIRMLLIHPPENYELLLGDIPERVIEVCPPGELVTLPLEAREEQLVHFFTTSLAELDPTFPRLKAILSSNGSLWISWPKRASGVQTDLNENIVREIGLKIGLVDVKICAVDEIWSGLKFVYRLVDRK